MQAIAELVTEVFMVLLCIVASPADRGETRIDILEERGYVDTLVVKGSKEDDWLVKEEKDGKLVPYASVRWNGWTEAV